MRKKFKYYDNGKIKTTEVSYIPARYILAILLTILEISLIISIVIILSIYFKYFYFIVIIITIIMVIRLIGSNDNPDTKVPWLLFLVGIPIIGVMLYLLFHKRILPKKVVRKLKKYNMSLEYIDLLNFIELSNKNELIYSQAIQLTNISKSHLYKNINLSYFKSGEEMYEYIIKDLIQAKEFIFLEFFIIEQGYFWNTILEILIRKIKEGVEVNLIYDDFGCMTKLPGNYYKKLRKYGINVYLFSKLKGLYNGELNNRSHRKILIIDGLIGYTGGINIADEYINIKTKFGYWKDTGIRLYGNAVNELTKLFLIDLNLNKNNDDEISFNKYYRFNNNIKSDSFVIPFGDGPAPIYKYNVSKTAILNILNQASKYVYIKTPYLIIDNELFKALENAALRGLDIKILLPHIPDKKLIFEITRHTYQALIKSGVKIYEYKPGFIHAKSYIADDIVGILGTMNLDYRSLTHHFENGVWIYNDNIIKEIKEDFLESIDKSIYMNNLKVKKNIFKSFIISILKIFSPLL